MRLKVEQIAYHRNGVCGEPFHVVLFRDGSGRGMVAIVLDEKATDGTVPIFVLDNKLLNQNEIRSDYNAWRGDTYAPELYRAIAEWEAQRRAA